MSAPRRRIALAVIASLATGAGCSDRVLLGQQVAPDAGGLDAGPMGVDGEYAFEIDGAFGPPFCTDWDESVFIGLTPTDESFAASSITLTQDGVEIIASGEAIATSFGTAEVILRAEFPPYRTGRVFLGRVGAPAGTVLDSAEIALIPSTLEGYVALYYLEAAGPGVCSLSFPIRLAR